MCSLYDFERSSVWQGMGGDKHRLLQVGPLIAGSTPPPCGEGQIECKNSPW